MKTRSIVLWVLLAVAIVAGLGAWWLATHKRVDKTIDLPRTGEARINPLYGLKLTLRQQGLRAQSWRRLDLAAMQLARRDTLLLYGDTRTLNAADERAVLGWVRQGGHLIVRTPPSDDATELLGEDFDASLDRVPLLSGIGLVISRERPFCQEISTGTQIGSVFCSGRRFAERPADAQLAWGDDEDGYVYLRLPFGRGTVSALADLDFLATDALKQAEHVTLAAQLLAPHDRAGTVHLVHTALMPSLLALLLQHSWMAWTPLVLLLLAWLWRRMQRFGPQLPPPEIERRSLLEHVVASGEHLWRYGYGTRLHTAVRDAFLARLRRRDPQAAALEGEAQLALLVERFGLPAAVLREALATPPSQDAAALRSRIATLIRLRNQL